MAGGGDSPQITEQMPWAPAQPYMQDIMRQLGIDVGDGGFFRDMMGRTGDLARDPTGGRPEFGEAEGTLRGIMDRPENIEDDPIYQHAQESIIPQVSGMFEGHGALHSGAARDSMTHALSDAFAGTDLQRQQQKMRAAGMMGQLGQGLLGSQLGALGLGSRQPFMPMGAFMPMFSGAGRQEQTPAHGFDPWGALAGGAMMAAPFFL